jgi:hypothetical protein
MSSIGNLIQIKFFVQVHVERAGASSSEDSGAGDAQGGLDVTPLAAAGRGMLSASPVGVYRQACSGIPLAVGL